MSNIQKVAFCEVFESKPALYFTDDNYHVEKIGAFVTADFSIKFSTVGYQTSGEVTAPQNFTLSQPLKIGDIIQVSLANFDNYDYIYYNFQTGTNSQRMILGNVLRRCFVISSIDGHRLVLRDYVEYNHSFVTVGYVGIVSGEPVGKITGTTGQREMRAFASRVYSYTSNGSTITTPFAFSVGFDVFERSVSFSDDFTSTNVKPYEVLTKSLQNMDPINNTEGEEDAIIIGSTIEQDAGGFYVFQYIRHNDASKNVSVRVKPSVNLPMTPAQNTNAATVWVQPDENADDYLRTHVFVGSVDASDTLKIKLIEQTTPEEYENQGITEIGGVLVSYTQLFEFEEDDNEKKQAQVDEMKKLLGVPVQRDKIKAVARCATSGNVDNLSSDTRERELYKIIVENLRKQILTAVSVQYTPLKIEISENDFYQTNIDLSGEENITLWYNSPLGGAILGESARCVVVEYSQDGRDYTIKTSPFKVRITGGEG